jgi:hypothetical protein
MRLAVLTVLLFSSCLKFANASTLPVTLISKAYLNPEGAVYEVGDGEININEDFLKRIEVGKNTLLFTFKNQTAKALRPNMLVKVFNKYGMLLGEKKVSWTFASVGPGEVRKEEESFYFSDLDSIF